MLASPAEVVSAHFYAQNAMRTAKLCFKDGSVVEKQIQDDHTPPAFHIPPMSVDDQRFYFESAILSLRPGQDESGPVIYYDEDEGPDKPVE
jgi:hypothetical protein